MSVVATAASLVVDAALGTWLGSMVFFSFLAAPRVFATLDRGRAGDVVNAIFPRYYVFGVALGVLAGAATVAWGAAGAFDAARLAVLAAAGVGVATAGYARWVLVPRMDAAGEDAFERYHRVSVALNGVTMLAVAVGLVASHL